MAKPIALAADHGGFELKEAVRAHLDEAGIPYIDFGTHSADSVDYPDMAVPACDAVVAGQCSKALLFCGTGVASAWPPIRSRASAPAAARTASAASTPAATTTPTPCAWAAAWWAPALPASWWTCSWPPPSRAAAMSAASKN